VDAAHERRNIDKGAASMNLGAFRTGNTFLSNLKTVYSGTYRVSDFAKYVHRYLAEVQYLDSTVPSTC